MTSLNQKLSHSAQKAALIAGLTVLGTFVLSPGTASNPVAIGAAHMQLELPLWASMGIILGGSSLATDFILPMAMSQIGVLSAGNPEIQKFENITLAPLLIGGISFAAMSVLSPESLDPNNSLAKQVIVAGGASLAAGTVASQLGFTNTSGVTY